MKWSNKQIVSWAKQYRRGKVTLMDMEDALGVSHSSIWWCFQNRLPELDVALYLEVMEQLDYNMRNKPVHKKGGRR